VQKMQLYDYGHRGKFEDDGLMGWWSSKSIKILYV